MNALLRVPLKMAVLLWLLAEALVLIIAIKHLGWSGTIGLGLAGFVLGAALLVKAGRAAPERLRRWMAGGETLEGSKATLDLLAAVLLIAPGFLTGLAGLAVMTQPVRKIVADRLPRFARAAPSRSAPLDLDPEEWRAQSAPEDRLPPPRQP